MLVTTPDIHTGAHYGQKFRFLVLERVYRNFHPRFLPRVSSMELDEGKDEILEKSKPSIVQGFRTKSILLPFLSPVTGDRCILRTKQ